MENKARGLVSRLFDFFLIIGIIYLSFQVFAPSIADLPIETSSLNYYESRPKNGPELNPVESNVIPETVIETLQEITPKTSPQIIEENENIESLPFHDEIVKDMKESLLDYDNPSTLSSMEKRVHELVNEERKKHGLSALEYDPQLSDIARAYSQDMAKRDFFSHFSPEGESFSDRYENAAYECRVFIRIEGNTEHYSKGGENLLKSSIIKKAWYIQDEYQYSETKTLEDIASGGVKGWMESPSHRKNILTAHWQKEGIGVAFSDEGRAYITQNFC